MSNKRFNKYESKKTHKNKEENKRETRKRVARETRHKEKAVFSNFLRNDDYEEASDFLG